MNRLTYEHFVVQRVRGASLDNLVRHVAVVLGRLQAKASSRRSRCTERMDNVALTKRGVPDYSCCCGSSNGSENHLSQIWLLFLSATDVRKTPCESPTVLNAKGAPRVYSPWYWLWWAWSDNKKDLGIRPSYTDLGCVLRNVWKYFNKISKIASDNQFLL